MAATRNVVILGAGHAGGRAAQALRETGFQGGITLIGEESYLPYERPPVSKELLASTMAPDALLLKRREYYEEKNISLRLNAVAQEIDRRAQRIRFESGASIPYDSLLLTTGARPRHLKLGSTAERDVHYLRGIDDCLALRAKLKKGTRLVVIGAGFIGLEAAAVARQLGCYVAVLEAAPLPLNRMAGPEVGRYFAELHRQNGVDLRIGVAVAAIERTPHGLAVVLDDGEAIVADAILAGIGAKPNDEMAAAAGLHVDDGVVVDEYGRTSDPRIYAAGDVTKHFNPRLGRRIRLESWQNAQDQATVVGKVMAGRNEPYSSIPWFWSDQYNSTVHIAGIREGGERLVVRGSLDDGRFTLLYTRDDVPIAGITVNNTSDMPHVKRLIARGERVDFDRLGDPGIGLATLLPGGAPSALPAAPNLVQGSSEEGDWLCAVAPSDVPEGRVLGLSLAGKHIALYRINGRLFATSNVCTHAFALLADGVLEGEEIECPLHLGRFNVCTGKALGMPVDRDLEVFPVRVKDGVIEVQIKSRQDGGAGA